MRGRVAALPHDDEVNPASGFPENMSSESMVCRRFRDRESVAEAS